MPRHITRGGTFVLKTNTGCPSLKDIAFGLGKISRFAGACNGWWTVLQHSLVCHDLAIEYANHRPLYKEEDTVQLALQMLLHDAHECITSDIPSHWKAEETKKDQLDLDKRIYKSLGVDYPLKGELSIISMLDEEALIAEAYTMFPMCFKALDRNTSLESKMIVFLITDLYDKPETTIGDNSEAVKKYKYLVNSYIEMIKGIKPYEMPQKIGTRYTQGYTSTEALNALLSESETV